jgi:hypothetical protein
MVYGGIILVPRPPQGENGGLALSNSVFVFIFITGYQTQEAV